MSTKSFLKWVGGKGKLLTQYKTYLPTYYNTYYEPFVGGGSMFFYLNPAKAVLSDVNMGLINAYRCLRNQPQNLINTLREMKKRHNKEYYYSIRAEIYNDSLMSAAQFIYLNKTCYNGLYRCNSKGKFNTPIGKYINPNICDEDTLWNCHTALKHNNVTLAVSPFYHILNNVKENDFVYLDPPYYPTSKHSFTKYNGIEFNKKYYIELFNIINNLTEKRVKIALSMSDCDIIKLMAKDLNIIPITRQGTLNSDKTKRQRVSELLITNY